MKNQRIDLVILPLFHTGSPIWSWDGLASDFHGFGILLFDGGLLLGRGLFLVSGLLLDFGRTLGRSGFGRHCNCLRLGRSLLWSGLGFRSYFLACTLGRSGSQFRCHS